MKLSKWRVFVLLSAISIVHVAGDGFQLAQSDDCGKVDEIPGEVRTKVPWVVGIFARTGQNKPFEFYVEGTIIGPTTILTVLGGVYGQTSADGRKYTIPPAQNHLVVAGLRSSDLQSLDLFSQASEVSHIIPFSKVDENNNQFHIFLFQLKKPLNFETPYVRAACLPVFSKTLPAKPFGLDAEVRQGGFSPAPNSKSRQLSIISPRIEKPEFCDQKYKEAYAFYGNTDHLYCGRVVVSSSDVNNNLQCTSYGSAPAVPVYKDRWFIIGVTALHPSFPREGGWCNRNVVYFYGRVLESLDWILENLKCPASLFACGDGECISMDKVCNRKAECTDRRDEDPIYCRARRPCNSPGKTFECGVYDQCLKNSSVCNGIKDCPNGEDESREVCGGLKIPVAEGVQPLSISETSNKNSNEKQCPPLQRSEGVVINCVSKAGQNISCSSPSEPGTVAQFECLKHYETTYRLPSTEMTCRDDGKWKPFRPFGCKAQCGVLDGASVQAYIVNGFATSEKEQFPWHTAIFAEKDINQYQFICGGSLIEKKILITAAHCVTDAFGNVKSPNQFKVALGGNSSDYGLTQRNDNAQVFNVEKILIPATYDRRTLQSDIALMKLDKEASYGKSVRPVCYLPRSGGNNAPSAGTLGKVPGFGYTADNKIAENLLTATFPVITDSECKESLKKPPPLATFCAGYKNGTSVCQGDSGGGMVFSEGENKNERYWLKGVVSHGEITIGRYCDAYNYAVFTHVDSFADWILQKLDVLT